VFFGADTMRIAELDEVAHRFDEIDLALLPINGLTIRPLLNRQVGRASRPGRPRSRRRCCAGSSCRTGNRRAVRVKNPSGVIVAVAVI